MNSPGAEMEDRTERPQWQALERLASAIRGRHLNALFERDAGRAERLCAQACGLTLDYSRQRIDTEVLEGLFALAEASGLRAAIEAMFAGERINHTESRAVLHTALRAPPDAGIAVDGHDVMPGVHAVLARMQDFADRVRGGDWRGHDGQAITDVVNIGIGGSDLGPRMVCEALGHLADGPRAHFIANVDGAPLSALLNRLDPATTLFIVTSKTFTTQETMANAHSARRWLVSAADEAAVGKHFVAVSTNHEAVSEFGIDADNVFGFWDWVGGRYSLWSAVGLSIAVALGFERFRALLDGAAAMDAHFRDAPFERNLPVLMALIAVWNRNFLKLGTQVIAPYREALARLPAWLQQLEMESNGKRVGRDGRPLAHETTPALWGDVGTNAQHAFFQMLHQGTEIHPVDFILPVAADHALDEQHRMLIANCLAQAAAMAAGRPDESVREELAAAGLQGPELDAACGHRQFPGNRPSNTLLMARLDPGHLGALLALYEHRTFVRSVIWGINAFDQWGVELGKRMARDVLSALDGGDAALDPATRRLVMQIRESSGSPD